MHMKHLKVGSHMYLDLFSCMPRIYMESFALLERCVICLLCATTGCGVGIAQEPIELTRATRPSNAIQGTWQSSVHDQMGQAILLSDGHLQLWSTKQAAHKANVFDVEDFLSKNERSERVRWCWIEPANSHPGFALVIKSGHIVLFGTEVWNASDTATPLCVIKLDALVVAVRYIDRNQIAVIAEGEKNQFLRVFDTSSRKAREICSLRLPERVEHFCWLEGESSGLLLLQNQHSETDPSTRNRLRKVFGDSWTIGKPQPVVLPNFPFSLSPTSMDTLVFLQQARVPGIGVKQSGSLDFSRFPDGIPRGSLVSRGFSTGGLNPVWSRNGDWIAAGRLEPVGVRNGFAPALYAMIPVKDIAYTRFIATEPIDSGTWSPMLEFESSISDDGLYLLKVRTETQKDATTTRWYMYRFSQSLPTDEASSGSR